jgi:hypothetical protein
MSNETNSEQSYSWEADSRSSIQEIPRFYVPQFITVFTKTPCLHPNPNESSVLLPTLLL